MNRLPKTSFIDRYDVKEFIGEGGMQCVYKAIDRSLNRVVALKTPKNSSAQKRFRRSAVCSSKINHHNVAKTYDYFIDDEQEYLIEEFIEGEDLREAILNKTEKIDPYLAAKILHHLAKGVAVSHQADVIHRDLKPNNIMICGKWNLDAIKITDFGIAKMAEEVIAEAAESEDSMAASKTMIGALPYMAPEMIASVKNAKKPSDIWALGAMTYELLCGDKPFGEGLLAISKIQKAEYSIDNIKNGVRLQFRSLIDDLCEIIQQCMQLEPDNRPTAVELVKKCEMLCYSTEDRYEAHVSRLLFRGSCGFIQPVDCSSGVFFHQDSVYGDNLKSGDKVCYSKFAGNPSERAHPVIKINSDDIEDIVF